MPTTLPGKFLYQRYIRCRTRWLLHLLNNSTSLLFFTSTNLLKPRTTRITQALNYFHTYFFTIKNSLYAIN